MAQQSHQPNRPTSARMPRRSKPVSIPQTGPRRLFNPDQKDVLDTFLLGISGVAAGKAFGYPVYAVGGTMFACLCGEGVAIKLPQKVARRLITKRANVSEFEPAPGKVWREWVIIQHESAADYMQDSDLFQLAIEYAAAEGASNGANDGSNGSKGGTRGKKSAKGS
jgi:hypothetical protein